MVTTIGTMLDKHVDDAAVQAKTLRRVLDLLETLDAHLAFQYNQGVDPGNEIETLTEIDWN